MELITEEKIKKNKLYIVKGQTKSFEPVIAKYKIEENSQTICNGNISEKYYKEVPKSYYSEIKYDDEYFKRIEKKSYQMIGKVMKRFLCQKKKLQNRLIHQQY